MDYFSIVLSKYIDFEVLKYINTFLKYQYQYIFNVR